MFGSHLSIAGGLHNALVEAERLGFSTVQVFTRNQQRWQAKPLADPDIALFRQHADRLSFSRIVAHDSYLINLAAVDEALRQKSIAAFAEEMRRCDQLGIACLVTHPGAHCGQGEEAGLAKVIAAFREILAGQPRGRVTVCIESTAGQGTCLGHRFEHLKAILDGVNHPDRMGVCLDTCHMLAAGYDLTTADSTRRVFDEFDRIVGLRHLKALHLNDSKKPLASRVDRHEHIGRGCVGLAAFEVICTDPRFAAIPKILETPKEKSPDGRDWDAVNLEILRTLAAGKKVTLPAPEPAAPFTLEPPARKAKAKKPASPKPATKSTKPPRRN